MRVRPLVIAILTLFSQITVLAVPASDGPIRSARELYREILEATGSTGSFALTATVSAVNFEEKNTAVELALADATGSVGVFCNSGAVPVRPQPGDRVWITGRITALHGWKRQGELRSLKILAHGDPPQRHRRTIRDLLSGQYDYQPVQIRATVRDAIRGVDNPKWTALGLVDNGCSLVVPVHADEVESRRLPELVGHDVLVDGFCSPTDPGLLHTGRQIRLCDPRAVRRAPETGAPRRTPSIDRIANHPPDAVSCLGLHSASGTVLAVWQGQHALIRTANGMAVRLELRPGQQPHVGDSVEAIGFPESNFISFTLLHASFEVRGHAETEPEEPQAPVLGASPDGKDDAIMPTRINHGRLVRVRGRIASLFGEKGWRELDIHGENGNFRIEAEPLASSLERLTSGCEVEITGICVLEAVALHGIRPQYTGVLLVPRDPKDLVVLSHPPFWTPRRLLGVIGALFVALVGILLWNVALRRAALRKGRELLHGQIKQLKAETKTLERTRLAVELHDSLAQSLTGVSMEIAAAERCSKSDVDAAMRHLAFATKALNSCRSNLRDNLWDLRNHALEEPNVDAAIRQTLLPHVRGVALTVRFNVLRNRLPDNVMHDILCIIRELSVNGIRHGAATQIKVAGCIDGTRVLFSVTDNGTGFDPKRSPGVSEGHYGLQGIRERLDRLHGTLTFDGNREDGIKAKVSLVLPEA